MKLPSLGEVVSVAQHNVRRFPFVLAAGAAATWAGLHMIESDVAGKDDLRQLVPAILALPLMFGLTVFAERRAATAIGRMLIPVAGILVLAGIWWLWPGWTEDESATRGLQLAAAFHLFCAFAPFIGTNEPRAFWQYNRILFIRFLAAALYSGVLFLGLAGAFLALDKLLGVPIANQGYTRLWFVIAFIFNPWFVVSGVPKDFGALDARDEYPTGLRVFTQYVLVPIVALYLAILTIYLGKVLTTRVWPSGWIGWLVSAVAATGILSWLLVHPLEERTEHKWVKTFTRGFYLAMMPATGMLLVAIWKRVDQYGITEKRYFLLVLAVWLAGIALYYTISRSRSIKLIPMSLCVLALLTFAGPQGAYSVSRRSQQARLESVLTANGLLADGTLKPAALPVADSAAKEISEGFRYLLEHHGEPSVRPWIRGDIERTIGAIGSGNAMRADAGAKVIVTALGVSYLPRYASDRGDFFSYYAERRREAVRIEGYTFAVPVSGVNLHVVPDTSSGLLVRAMADPPAIEVLNNRVRVMNISLQPLLDSVAQRRQRVPTGGMLPEQMTLEARDGNGAALVVLTQISGRIVAGKKTLNSLDGFVYLRLP
jgi:hypothetical protein